MVLNCTRQQHVMWLTIGHQQPMRRPRCVLPLPWQTSPRWIIRVKGMTYPNVSHRRPLSLQAKTLRLSRRKNRTILCLNLWATLKDSEQVFQQCVGVILPARHFTNVFHFTRTTVREWGHVDTASLLWYYCLHIRQLMYNGVSVWRDYKHICRVFQIPYLRFVSIIGAVRGRGVEEEAKPNPGIFAKRTSQAVRLEYINKPTTQSAIIKRNRNWMDHSLIRWTHFVVDNCNTEETSPV